MKSFPDIPGYRIRRRIGTGGMGEVYLAQQASLDRRVALKVMLASLLEQDPRFAERFEREALTTARLRHPNIITVYDSGETGGRCYIAMDFIEGGSLKERIAEGTLSTSQILRITYGLCAGLRHAHEAGLVHRDIKPANILLDSSGNPVITDFGIVKITSSNTELTGTSTVGSPTYMSPEQLLGAPSIDGRADLYSLGVVLYEMLEGQPPFRSDAAYAVGMKHLNDDPPPLAPRNRRFQPIVSRLLEKSPDKRFDSAAQLMIELRRMRNAMALAPEAAAPAPARAGSAVDEDTTKVRNRARDEIATLPRGERLAPSPEAPRWDPDRVADPPGLKPVVGHRPHKAQLRDNEREPARRASTKDAPLYRQLWSSTIVRLALLGLGLWIAWAVFLPGVELSTVPLELRALFGSPAEKSRIALRFSSLGRPGRSTYWMEKAAEGGHPGASYEVGLRYHRSREEVRAVKAFEAELAGPIGDIWDQPSVLMLGELLCNGRPPEDCARATRLLEGVVERHGDERAMVKLGEIHLARQDAAGFEAALGWFSRVVEPDRGQPATTAAERDAMINLATMHAQGLGVSSDQRAATQWLVRAARSPVAERPTVHEAERRCADADLRSAGCSGLQGR